MKRDPITQGNDIFIEIIKKYPDLIRDESIAISLIKQLIDKTDNWVIVDFLEYGGWDRLSDIYTDDFGHVILIQDSIPNQLKSGLIFKFKDIIAYQSEAISGIFIRGFTLKENYVKKTFNQNAKSFEIIDKRNFSVDFERKVNETEESFTVLNAPLYSVAIIPKNTPLGPQHSQEVLFLINFDRCLRRLKERKILLKKISQDDEDSICEKANTGRRVFEFVLKIECCLIEHNVSFLGYEKDIEATFKKDYDKLLLGDLKKLVKDFKPSNRQSELNDIISISNKLSHDSGHAIHKHEAEKLLDLMIDYTSELLILVGEFKKLNFYYTKNLKKRYTSQNL